jgi:hypothetical protein
VWGVWGVCGVWGSRPLLTFDIPQTALVATLDTYDFNLMHLFQECNSNSCPVWTEWTEWTACSVTCGGGKRQKSRECVLPEGARSRDLFCPGESLVVKKCNENKCPS